MTTPGKACWLFLLASCSTAAWARDGGHSPSPLVSANPALIIALHTHQEARAARLIRSGADVNERDKFGRTPLEVATLKHISVPIIQSLLDAGAKVNSPGEHLTALGAAIATCYAEVIPILLSEGADPSLPVGPGHEVASEYAVKYGCQAARDALAKQDTGDPQQKAKHIEK